MYLSIYIYISDVIYYIYYTTSVFESSKVSRAVPVAETSRPPLEGALYAIAGGIFTLVLLVAQVISISALGEVAGLLKVSMAKLGQSQ